MSGGATTTRELKSTESSGVTKRKRPTIFYYIFRSKPGTVGWVVFTLFVLIGVLGPFLTPVDPTFQDLPARNTPPTLGLGEGNTHLLGTDQLGRDIFTRIVYGARTSLTIGAFAVIVGGVIGGALGISAGYFRGWFERIVMRLVDIFLAFPFILLALVVIAILGPSLLNLIIVLGVTGWVNYARVLRGEVLSLREQEYVTAARVLGGRDIRILARHILPNTIPTFTVIATLELARVIILEGALSFLGLGVQPPTASWGRMLADGRDYLATAWWVATFPGLAIVVVVLSVNLMGDWLRDYLDPRQRRGR